MFTQIQMLCAPSNSNARRLVDIALSTSISRPSKKKRTSSRPVSNKIQSFATFQCESPQYFAPGAHPSDFRIRISCKLTPKVQKSSVKFRDRRKHTAKGRKKKVGRNHGKILNEKILVQSKKKEFF